MTGPFGLPWPAVIFAAAYAAVCAVAALWIGWRWPE